MEPLTILSCAYSAFLWAELFHWSEHQYFLCLGNHFYIQIIFHFQVRNHQHHKFWSDCEALRVPEHQPEEFHNGEVLGEDVGLHQRLHHLPVLGHEHPDRGPRLPPGLHHRHHHPLHHLQTHLDHSLLRYCQLETAWEDKYEVREGLFRSSFLLILTTGSSW